MSNAESVDHNANMDGDPDVFPRPFGQYLLLENFARGGMGEVYLAKIGGIAGLERYCVLKKLRSELTRDREYVTRFIDEARVVVTLNHANICHVFDVGRVGEEYYLAMEYISGRDVRTAQDRSRTKERSFPPATALHLVCETLEALDYAHRRNHPLTGEPLNLVHRDVSPQNVLVSFEGEVKLIDFGLAASRLKVERTQPNVVMGKMAYMAPEQARGDPIDARADLFACGVLAYELLSGERFYEGMTANDIWQVAGKGGFIPRRWSAIDPELQRHLAKALHPDPRKRYATCGDFREALASHMHWKFPGTGVRGLREVMNELFADEIRKENELLARFGKVTVAGFRTEFEESRSTSVSLARADEESSAHHASNGARLVRNEQSSSAPLGSMPPPMRDQSREGQGNEHTRDTVIRDRSVSGEGRDVHREATRLVGERDLGPNEGTDAIPKDRSTDEQTGSVANGGSATQRRELTAPTPEPTQRVNRRKSVHDAGTELVVRPLSIPDDDVTAAPAGRRWTLWAAAAGAVVALVVLAWVVSREPTSATAANTSTNTNATNTSSTSTSTSTSTSASASADLAPAPEAVLAVDKAAADAKAAAEAKLAEEANAKAAAEAKLAEEAKAAKLIEEAKLAEETERAEQARREAERVAAAAAVKTETKKEKAERKRKEREREAEKEAREKADKPPPVERVVEKPRETSRKTAVAALRDPDVVRIAAACACNKIVTEHTMKRAPLSDVRACLVATTDCALPK